MDLQSIVILVLVLVLLGWLLMSMTTIKKCVVAGKAYFAENVVREGDPESETLHILAFVVVHQRDKVVAIRTKVPAKRKRFKLCFLGKSVCDADAWYLMDGWGRKYRNNSDEGQRR